MITRFNMFDLCMVAACGAVAGLCTATFSTDRTIDMTLALAVFALLCVGVVPIVYRLRRARPMRFPRCPHCQCADGDGPWFGRAGSQHDRIEDMMCGPCGRLTSFIYDGDVTPVEVQREHAYALRWPRQLGRWRRLR